MAILDMNRIRYASAQRYVVHLQDKMTEMVGFLPVAALTHQLDKNRIIMAEHNDAPCGYISRGPWKPTTTIYQTAIEFELWREKHGDELVAELVAQAKKNQVEEIKLHCAEDLFANEFWRAMGFQLHGGRVKSKHRRRWQNEWRLRLDHALALDRLVEQNAIRPEAAAAAKLMGLDSQVADSLRRKARRQAKK